MPVSNNDKLRMIGDNIFDKVIGYTPTSDSVKPIHIANGLFRRCYGEHSNVSGLHEWVIRGAKRTKNEVNSAEMIKDKYSTIIDQVDSLSDDDLNEFRALLEAIYNHDQAAYPSYKNSVLNISSRRLITSHLPAEASIDKFLYEVLSAKIDGKPSEIITIINELLRDDKDDITRLAMPIIALTTPCDGNPYTRKTSDNFDMAEDITLNNSKLVIRKGFDLIAKNIRHSELKSNKLAILQRIVNFSSFAIIYNLISANVEKNKDVIAPMLFSINPELSSITKASEESFLYCKLSVEKFYSACVEDQLNQEVYDINSNDTMLEYISNMLLTDQRGISSDERRTSLKALYTGFYNEGIQPIKALAQAIQFLLFSEYDTNPSDFCRALGVRAGLIGPIANRANKKRFLPTPFLLETLAYSVIDIEHEGEGLEIKEFGQRLWDTYGIMFGAKPDEEYDYLERLNISSRVPGDLRGELAANSFYLAEMYISMGHGKRYADGVATIELGV